ncbi:MAG: NAD(P)H-hydrate epimerase [Candidatus Omnitrophica bacterium]|nr:NAD(P)H-hydrate epimerase [Candidatus Omnitrophota bacterium]
MQKVITPAAMQRLDRLAREKYGIPSLILMENAGRSAAEEALWLLAGKKKRAVCVAGRGNNGGDGFVCVRHLLNHGVKAEVFLIKGAKELKGDARKNFLILGNMGCPIRFFEGEKDAPALRRALGDGSLVIDAIFGIGFSGAARPPYDRAIDLVNHSRIPVLSLDVPSGLDALNGRAAGPCIQAHTTVTFGFSKTGLKKNEGPRAAGRLLVVDISLPWKRP